MCPNLLSQCPEGQRPCCRNYTTNQLRLHDIADMLLGDAARISAGWHDTHLMLHCRYTTDASYKEFEQMRVSMEPLTYKHGVDVFFYGHVHAYERTAPMVCFPQLVYFLVLFVDCFISQTS